MVTGYGCDFAERGKAGAAESGERMRRITTPAMGSLLLVQRRQAVKKALYVRC